MSKKEIKVEQPSHEFYCMDVACDYQFTELDNLLFNIAGGLPLECLTEREQKMILEKYPNFFDEEEYRDEVDLERMKEGTHSKGPS